MTVLSWVPAARRLAVLVLLLLAAPLAAHPVPYSYLDLRLGDEAIDGTLVIHAIDAAHELDVPDPDTLLDHDVIEARYSELAAKIGSRIAIAGYGPDDFQWGEPAALPDRRAIALPFHLAGEPPGKLTVRTNLFPYDPAHLTFVNVYDGGAFRQQWGFSAESKPETYYRGTSSGVLAVIGTFIPMGAHHILIGPDHLLFLFGLLLLGGGLRRLAGIITAFTIGHSITLTLAALDIVTLPGSIVEPAIAVTIVVVGADNLMRGEGKDLRFWMALAFGTIHGFGFASVLKETGLPQSALGWSLFSFNVGVELGQLAVVVPVAFMLAALRRKRPDISKRVVQIGSILVIVAGSWWFVQRVFLTGGM